MAEVFGPFHGIGYAAEEDYGAMGTYDASREDIDNTIDTIKHKHPTFKADRDSVYYLTYQSGSSNKFHCFILVQDNSGSWYAMNGAARIGYGPQVYRIAGPTSQEQARGALVKKMRTKERKGYSIMFSPTTTRWYKSEEMDYMELPVIPDSYGTDSATEMGGRGVPVWYGSAEWQETDGSYVYDDQIDIPVRECRHCDWPMEVSDIQVIKPEGVYMIEVTYSCECGGPDGKSIYHEAEGMEMTPDIMDYPGLPVVPDSYGTNSALASGQGVPQWYGSAETFEADEECPYCDDGYGHPQQVVNGQYHMVCEECGEMWREPVDTRTAPTTICVTCGEPLLPTNECVCAELGWSAEKNAETFEARGGEMAHMTPDLLWENIGGFWKAVGINPEYDMGGNGGTGGNAGAAGGEGSGSGSGQAQGENGNAGGSDEGQGSGENGEGDQAESRGGPSDPQNPDVSSAEGANPSGGSTGNQIVSWESGGLSSPSGPPSDIYWAEDDDGKFLCDSCGKLADFNFQDIDVRWDIDDGEFTGNYELRQHLGDYNDFLCLTCAEKQGFAAEGGRGKWSEADAAHALLRRKSKKQRTIDRKRSRQQKYSAEEERIRTARELVDYVDNVLDGVVPCTKPFTLPPYLETLISQDKAQEMSSQDELDIMFRDGSMASCIYDAGNQTLNTFVVAYDGDSSFNSETLNSYDWDKTEYEKKDLELVKPFGTAMKATMGVAAGTAAIIGIMVALTKLGGNNE